MDKMAIKRMTKRVTKRISQAGMFVGLAMISAMVAGCQNIPQARLLESPKAVTTVLEMGMMTMMVCQIV